MSLESDRSRTSDSPALEELSELELALASCLELEGTQREAWLEELTGRAPERARELRVRLGLLGELGLSSVRTPSNRRTIAGYRLQERIGLGGMGEVWRCLDPHDRCVALKLVRPELLWFEGAKRRFEREARAASALDHDGIARVLDVGEEDGLPWMALEWIDGASLEDVLGCLRGRVPVSLLRSDFLHALAASCHELHSPSEVQCEGDSYRALVTLALAKVADALAHAHARGVVHRDVKPSNILIGVDGRVRLVDFGLALFGESSRLTRTGSWLGSLPYAAPEQLEGAGEADGRADIYSLGATLFECLGLVPPFRGARETELRARILSGHRQALRRANPSVPRALELVCDRAMDLDPTRRYSSAAQLAEDLRHAARDEGVAARPAPGWLRLLRWSRRHARLSAALLLVLLTVAATTAWAVRERRVSAQIRRMADSELAARLSRQSDAFWPPDPTRLGELDAWLAAADQLQQRASVHEEALQHLRERALPDLPGQDPRGRAEARAYLLAMRLEVEGLAHVLAQPELERERIAPLASELVSGLVAQWGEAFQRDTASFLDDFEARIGELRRLVSTSSAHGELADEQLADFGRRLGLQRRALLEPSSVRFESEFDQWQNDELEDLARQLSEFGRRATAVRALRERARIVAGEQQATQAGWQAALRAMRASPRYQGVALRAVPALRPLRANPTSGLWEFLLIDSGDAPVEAPSASDPTRLRIDERTGIVLVLLPGGEFWMGTDTRGPERSSSTLPRHRVRLDPFLVSKYELTMAQARRLSVLAGVPLPVEGDATRPVRIQWQEGHALLRASGLECPTEAQWEYAAAAGGAFALPPSGTDKPSRLLPVGSSLPNGNGLYDMLGSVGEWCLDWFIERGYSTLPSRPGDGLKETVLTGPGRAVRGGHFTDDLSEWSLYRRTPGNQSTGATTGLRPVMHLP